MKESVRSKADNDMKLLYLNPPYFHTSATKCHKLEHNIVVIQKKF